MQAAQDLTHFLPKVPLLTCPKLTFAFFTIYFYSFIHNCNYSVTRRFMGFFPFHYFFQLINSHFWFVIVSLPQPRCPILTLLTIHFFVCDSLDSVYFQQLHDRLATEFQQGLRHCISTDFMLQLYLCRTVQNHDIINDDKGGTYCLE